VSRNYKIYYNCIIVLIGFVLFVNSGLTNALPNDTITNSSLPIALPNDTITNSLSIVAKPNSTQSNGQTNQVTTSTSSSITETVNDVLSGSIDGMIGDTVNMLSHSAKAGKDSVKNSVENELPSSLTLGKNNSTIVGDSTKKEKIVGNLSANTFNLDKQNKPINESTPDSVNEIKQLAQNSMYNATIAQSFDNNSLTKLHNQNTLDELVYKMKNILDIDLFK
jgi:hypothetical protein